MALAAAALAVVQVQTEVLSQTRKARRAAAAAR
jgi:hypothetical protein